ncbi:hypothetical protein A2U01_0091564, partial [Trifolium medium]|nr:hypothetical protein [Trifolium medium]
MARGAVIVQFGVGVLCAACGAASWARGAVTGLYISPVFFISRKRREKE